VSKERPNTDKPRKSRRRGNDAQVADAGLVEVNGNGHHHPSRKVTLRIRLSKAEADAWRVKADATSEGNVSRFVRDIVNQIIAREAAN